MDKPPLGPTWLLAVGSRPARPTTAVNVAETLTGYGLNGATLLSCLGIWKGSSEDTVLALVAGLNETQAFHLARFLASRFEQEATFLNRVGTAYLVAAATEASLSALGSSQEPVFATEESRPNGRATNRKGLSRARGRSQNPKKEPKRWKALAQQ